MDYTENIKLYKKTEDDLYNKWVKKGEDVIIYDIVDDIKNNKKLKSSNGYYYNAIRLLINIYNRLGFDGDYWYEQQIKEHDYRDLIFDLFD